MRVTPKSHPELWAQIRPSFLKRWSGLHVDDDFLQLCRVEAETLYAHYTPDKRELFALHNACTHPGFHGFHMPEAHRRARRGTRIAAIIIGVLLLLLVSWAIGHANPPPVEYNVAFDQALAGIRVRVRLVPQIVVNPSQFKFDASGNLDVNCIIGCGGGGGTTNVNLIQLNSVALGSPSAYGVSPGAVNVLGVNAFVTNTPTVNQGGAPWSVSASGNFPVTQVTSPWVTSCTPANCSFNVAQWNAVALGSPSAYGTSPGAVNVPGVNAFVTNTVPVTGTFFPATQPVSCAAAATCPVNASQVGGPWTQNITQWGSTTLGTPTNFGTTPGAVIAASVNASLFSGTTALGTPNTFGVTAPTGNALGVNSSLFIGPTLAINGGVAGSLAVGGVSANNTAITQNPDLIGVETIAQGSQPTVATAGNQRRVLGTTEGVPFVQQGSSNRFSCFVQAVTVTTQCQAAPAAGLRAYVMSVNLSNQAGSVQTLDIVFGTGANCVTGITAITHKFQFGTLALTTSPIEIGAVFSTPLIPAAANAICIRPSAATAFGATLAGFIAP